MEHVLDTVTVTRDLRPGRAIAWLWATAVVLTLFSAKELQKAARLQALGTPPVGGEPAGDPTGEPAEVPAVAAAVPAPQDSGRVIRRVLLIGASSMQFHLGTELERALNRDFPGLVVVRVGKLSTGLTRPDVFDWPETMRRLIAEHHPDLVVANFGGNDAQGMVLSDRRVVRFGRPQWDAAYRARVVDVVNIGHRAGAQVVLLGMSTTRDAGLSRRMQRINTLTAQAAQATGASYLSIWDLGADAEGRYKEMLDDGGVAVRSRLADGKHFSRAGATVVAGHIVRRLAASHRLPPARTAQAP